MYRVARCFSEVADRRKKVKKSLKHDIPNCTCTHASLKNCFGSEEKKIMKMQKRKKEEKRIFLKKKEINKKKYNNTEITEYKHRCTTLQEN